MKLYKTKEYRIMSVDGKMLTADEDNLVTAREESSERAQLWKFAPEKDGAYRLINAQSKKALDIIDGGDMNGAWVHQWEITDTKSQLWMVEEEGQIMRLRSVSSGRYLDVALEDGIHVQIWEKGGDNQLWKAQVVEKPKASKSTNAIKEKEPAAIKVKEPSAIKKPEPTAIKEKEPSAIKEKEPSAIKAVEPGAIKAAEPAAKPARHPSKKGKKGKRR